MSSAMKDATAARPALRLCVRHRRMEQELPDVWTGEGAAVGMEPAEQRKMDLEPTKHVAGMARAVEMEYEAHYAYAVDGSKDEAAASGEDKVRTHAAARCRWHAAGRCRRARPTRSQSWLPSSARWRGTRRATGSSCCATASRRCSWSRRRGDVRSWGRSARWPSAGAGCWWRRSRDTGCASPAPATTSGREACVSYGSRRTAAASHPTRTADAIAKSHLAEAPQDVPLECALRRACMYVVAEEGGGERRWTVAAD